MKQNTVTVNDQDEVSWSLDTNQTRTLMKWLQDNGVNMKHTKGYVLNINNNLKWFVPACKVIALGRMLKATARVRFETHHSFLWKLTRALKEFTTRMI
jgi:hypothetical protein